MKTARQVWFELDDPPRRALLLERPAELKLMAWRSVGEMSPEHMHELITEQVVGWRGFTEADFLGASIGSSDEQPFSKELFKLWAEDSLAEMTSAGIRIMEIVQATAKQQADVAKN